MAVQAPAVDMDKLMTFLGQVIGELGATVNAGESEVIPLIPVATFVTR